MRERFNTLILLALFIVVISSATLQQDIQTIINKHQQLKGSAYELVAQLSDNIGPRMWGSQALQKAIHFMYKKAKQQNFDNIRLQPVKNFTKWVRGHQQLILYEPRIQPFKLKLIGLGYSISGQVNATGIVVRTFQQADQLKDQIKGKILIFNQQWVDYDTTVQYRAMAARYAGKYGAVAALVRSVTPISVSSVHAGTQYYDPKYPKVPVAAISMEDAQMFQRMHDRGQQFRLYLKLENTLVPNSFSNNLVFEIEGTQNPEQILLLGGHIDSWDTGSQTGANDDGGGFVSCFEALRLIKRAGLKPKRTLRFIAWSGQQMGNGRNGNKAYFYTHRDQIKNHIVAFEDDYGSTKLLGFGFLGNENDRQKLSNLAQKYLAPINATLINQQGQATDTGPLYDAGVPTMQNVVQDTKDGQFYFTYHHTAGDSMTMMSSQDLDSNVVGIASMFYLLANTDTLQKPVVNQAKIDEIVNNYKNFVMV